MGRVWECEVIIIIDLLLLKEEMDQPIIEEEGSNQPASNGQAVLTNDTSTGVAVKQKEGVKVEDGVKAEAMMYEDEIEQKRHEVEDLLDMPPEMQ